jgi:type IV pilus assembly protein PilW
MSNKQLGFSVVEVMLALALGALLLISLGKIYLSMKQAYYMQTDIARMQENGRLATHILTNNIQMAGYGGCRAGNLTDALHGYNSSNAPEYLRNKINTNTDIIIIKKANTDITHLTQNINSATNTIYVEDNPATSSQKQLLISDCQTAQLFNATNTAKNSIKTNIIINHHYQKQDTEIARFTEIAYFIGKTTRKNPKNEPIYALYSVTNQGNKQELIEDIKSMQIQYIINYNYYAAEQIKNWNQVQAVAITLNLTFGDKTKPWKIYIPLKQVQF